ncbi:hypothetical protein EGW08_017199 [Elysia chlorotica]|uniref:Fibrinogen C-terminal domain-containing protein n=1 Tax=Elysia chlorotica TaxID=188477 RepID=A0A433T0E6_ELYCH|nr:hypothetical protein EGW08_017199 [Elysia chlorotica]
MRGVFDSWEEKLTHLKDKLQEDMDSIKADLNTKTYRLEDKLENLEKALNTQTDRLEDKLESLQREAEARANRFEDKLESAKNRLEDKLTSGDFRKPDELVSCTGEVKQASLAGDVAAINDGLSLLGIEIRKQRLMLEEQDNLAQAVKNLTRIYGGLECESGKDMAREFYQNLTSLYTNLEETFYELSSNVSASAREMSVERASPYSLTAGLGFQSSMAQLLTPKTCFKGMAFSASLASSAYSVMQPGAVSGVPVPILCDRITDGGGWVVIQRRVSGDVNFYRGWADYKLGFGSLDGDFWLGNDNIHALTSQGDFELRVDLRFKGKSGFASYGSFSMGSEASRFALHVSHSSGTAGDSLTDHNGLPFSTYDRDNDNVASNCAVTYVGAWWYGSCHASNLNGQWGAGDNRGPRWGAFSGAEPVSYSEMKVRRVIGAV